RCLPFASAAIFLVWVAFSFAGENPELEQARREYQTSSQDEAARVRYVTKLAKMWAQVAPKIPHNRDVDARIAFANQAAAIEEELARHPMPPNVDPKKLSQLLLGEWQSLRHTYVFRVDGTYGMIDTDERDKWRIDGNEYSDEFERGPIILLDRHYFIYACGDGITVYTRANGPGNSNSRQTVGPGSQAKATRLLEKSAPGVPDSCRWQDVYRPATRHDDRALECEEWEVLTGGMYRTRSLL
ncbi:MAG TPA: hypothetical protein VJ728_14145, partial [Candidatus Binataceae bacterium]|nr:hypothetical protein [Candidatus Binataceae bacterium]